MVSIKSSSTFPPFATVVLTGLVILLSLLSCGKNTNSSNDANQVVTYETVEEGQHNFINVTKASGIDFIHNMGDEHLSNVIESVGGGCAFLDFNQNGLMDIYIASGSFHEILSSGDRPQANSVNVLYENIGNGRFKNSTAIAGVGDTGYSMAVTVADFNNDGFPDIHVSNHGPNKLYRNDGNGTYTDITDRAGVAGNESSAGAVWLDYNNDGFLDLYVANYVEFNPELNLVFAPDGYPGPLNFNGQPDVLYRNNGNETFNEVTAEMGIFNPDGRAMGVGSIDIDEDGFPEIFVANDAMANYYFKNDSGTGYRDIAMRSGLAFNRGGEAVASMGVSFADYNGDGLIDFFVADDSYNSLYQNQGGGLFTEVSFPSGIAVLSGQHVSWSAAFMDYDNNMLKDIFIVNGDLKHLYGQEDQLFVNNGDGTFQLLSTDNNPYFSESMVARGSCFGDYDNDGDVDVFIVNLNEPAVLLRNDIGNQNNWLMVNLVGTQSNRDGVGATVRVTTGETTQLAQKTSGGPYLSQNDPRLHFGLLDYEIIDRIEVKWPSGIIQVLEDVSVNQILTIQEQ